MGLLSGLSSLGLGNLENISIYEEPKEEKGEGMEAKAATEILEKDLLLDRTYECPVCSSKFTSKSMKTGKTRMLQSDKDLRAIYEGIDVHKYDAVTCAKCGFSAVTRFFRPMSTGQMKLIRDNICGKVQLKPYNGEIYTYEEALERYKLSLACAVVKQAKPSEKAYTCLKSAWVLRGYAEELAKTDGNEEKIKKVAAEEKEYLENALEGFVAAKENELYPIAGMDESTLDYLMAALAYELGKYDISSRLVSNILISSSANARMKDKTRALKEEIIAVIKRKKG